MLSDGAHATRDQPDLREIRAVRPHIPREDRQPAGLSVCAHEKIREHAEVRAACRTIAPEGLTGCKQRTRRHALERKIEVAYCGLVVGLAIYLGGELGGICLCFSCLLMRGAF
jgi:hypothetical protein